MSTAKSKLEIRNSKFEEGKTAARPATAPGGPPRVSSRSLGIDFRVSLFLLGAALLHASCGAPAEPQPRHPTLPARITDLAAVERGDGALLTFTPPAKSTEGKRLAASPTIEILRGFAPAGAAAPPPGGLAVVYTLPGQVLNTYLESGRVEFRDALDPQEIVRHAGAPVFYAVRCRVTRRAASEDSNLASFVVHPAPAAIAEVRATVVEQGVQLAWQAPSTVSGGAPLTALEGFRIYRAAAPAAPAGEKRREEPALLASPPSPQYLDSQIEWGKTYVYTVRAVARAGADSVESADSPPVEVTPKDIFPPAPPVDLVAVFVPAAGAAPAAVELSWSISPEPDAAGYYVYRAGEGEAKAQRVTPGLLPTPAFRDTSVVPGARYTYSVSAVDRSGNESRPSASVSAVIPKADD